MEWRFKPSILLIDIQPVRASSPDIQCASQASIQLRLSSRVQDIGIEIGEY
jgi:hypothetical protein